MSAFVDLFRSNNACMPPLHASCTLGSIAREGRGSRDLNLLSSNCIVEIAEREILRRLIEVEGDFLDEQVLGAGAGDGGAEHFPVGLSGSCQYRSWNFCLIES